MNLNSNYRIPWPDYLILIAVLSLAFYIAFIPHQNYPYPLHIDEWFHLAYSNAMLTAGSVQFAEPFLGQSTIGLSSNLEAGFHLFLGVFQRISGLSWVTIFRYFPGILFMMTILSVYILGRRQGFGWEAAFFTCLIPTTVGILGPAFLVPVAMGLVFIPLCLFMAFNFRSLWSYITIFVFASFLLSIHAPSAICLVIILGPYILLNIKGNLRHSTALMFSLVVPFLVPFPWIFDLLLPTAKELLVAQPLKTYVDYPRIMATYGYLPIFFLLLGTFVLVISGSKKDYGLSLGLLAILCMLAVFYSLHYGVPIVYERGLMFSILMVSVVAGAGLMWVKNIKLPDKLGGQHIPEIIRCNIGRALCVVAVVIVLVVAIPARQSTPYYNMIDTNDYEAFTWISNNIGDEYEKAILDPWKATAFTAITGKYVFTRIHAYPKDSDRLANKFLDDGCMDTDFLRENGISIVYTTSCYNPDLTKVRENIYVLK